MKLIHFIYNKKENIGILEKDEIKILDVKDFNELISKYDLDKLNEMNKILKPSIKRSDITPIPFIKKSNADIICAGMNYYSHKEECIKEGVDKKDRTASVYFSKRGTNIITSNELINRHSDITNECDYEGELGVILYKDIYKPNKEEIFNSIFGYVIINDVSARDLQRYHQQYYFAKSLDTYMVMSEVLLTRDTFDDYHNFNIKTYVNNELRQDDNTSNMIYLLKIC